MLGIPVAKQLAAAGFELTALVRNPETAKGKLPAGTKLVQGDLRNPESVDQLLAGQDALYINLAVQQTEKKSDWHAEGEGISTLVESAKKNLTRRIVLLSSLVQRYEGMNNFHWWAFQLKTKAIEAIKGSGIPYTIFYPSTFMESFLGKYKQGKRILMAGVSEFPMYYIAGEDYGKQVARALQLPDEKMEFVVQGLEPLTQEGATAIFLKHYTKEKLSQSSLPLGVLKFIGNFVSSANYGAHIIEAMTKYPEKFESEDTWRILGTPVVTLKEFAESA